MSMKRITTVDVQHMALDENGMVDIDHRGEQDIWPLAVHRAPDLERQAGAPDVLEFAIVETKFVKE
jgi:hypothetical protein